MVKVMMIPNFFKCPISLELMEDPVTLCTGQTYERLSIQTWFAKGHKTDPSTMQVLSSLDVVPNDMLRNLIQDWFAVNSGHAVILGGSKSARRMETMADVRKEILREQSLPLPPPLPLPSPAQMLALPATKDTNGLMLRIKTLTVMMQNAQTRRKGYHRLSPHLSI